MSTNRIVCTEQSRPSAVGHGHILAVGLGTDPNQATNRETVETVRANLLNGDVYYTVGPRTGKLAYVYRYDCPCGVKTVRSTADATTDNNLDSLRLCNFS
jgi:hypothetical protein